MSARLISLNADLQHLLEEGYSIEVCGAWLLVHDVPYVTANKTVATGTLASSLTAAGERLLQQDHTAWLAGSVPCDAGGAPLNKVILSGGQTVINGGLVLQHYLSSKPVGTGVYADFYDKMTSYVNLLGSHAQVLDRSATARKYRPIAAAETESVFKYVDTASARARIDAITAKLRSERVAIVGLGGTGSYILDLVAKTPVAEIHLFDRDNFQSHNAFRTPGAASLEELNDLPSKVEYLARLYSRMRHGIVPHPVYIGESTISLLRDKTLVFVCVDKGSVKDLIFRSLEAWNIPFIDVGMGIGQVGDALDGTLRVTTSTPEMRDHILSSKLVSFADGEEDDLYEQNIQVADLNMLNAALAVIRWKKLRGFYVDMDREHQTLFTIDGTMLTNSFRP